MNQTYVFPHFALRLTPKCASANIESWCRKHKITKLTSPPTGMPLYQIWRPAQERIWSGIATDLQRLSHPDGGFGTPWYKDKPEIYQNTIRKWAGNLTMEPSLFSHSQHYYKYGEADHFVSMDKVKELHSKVGISEACSRYHAHQVNWLSAKDLKKELRLYPEAIDFITDWISKDTFVPELKDWPTKH